MVTVAAGVPIPSGSSRAGTMGHIKTESDRRLQRVTLTASNRNRIFRIQTTREEVECGIAAYYARGTLLRLPESLLQHGMDQKRGYSAARKVLQKRQQQH